MPEDFSSAGVLVDEKPDFSGSGTLVEEPSKVKATVPPWMQLAKPSNRSSLAGVTESDFPAQPVEEPAPIPQLRTTKPQGKPTLAQVEAGAGEVLKENPLQKIKADYGLASMPDDQFLREHPELKLQYGLVTDMPMARVNAGELAQTTGLGKNTAGVIAGAQNAVADLADFMTSAPGIMTVLTGGVAGAAGRAGAAGLESAIHRTTAQAFAADMARNYPDQVLGVMDSLAKKDTAGATRQILNAALALGVVGGATRATMAPKLPVDARVPVPTGEFAQGPLATGAVLETPKGAVPPPAEPGKTVEIPITQPIEGGGQVAVADELAAAQKGPNAIQKRSAETPVMGETPGSGAEVGARVPGTEKPAEAQPEVVQGGAPKGVQPKEGALTKQQRLDSKEFDDLVKNPGAHPDYGWYNAEMGDVHIGANPNQGIASRLHSEYLNQARTKAMSELGTGGNPLNMADRAAALPALKARIASIEKLTPVPLTEIPDGSEFTIHGEKFTAVNTNPDTGIVTLKDGRTIRVDENSTVKIDPGSLRAKPKGDFAPESPKEIPILRPGEKGTGDLLQGQDAPFNLMGEKGADAERIAAEKSKAEQAVAAKAQAEKEHPTLPGTESEQGQTADPKSDPFERARVGDESAFDDLDAQFREVYPEEVDFGRGRTDPNTVRTPQAFASLFDRAFAARDFDTILNAIKATSDVSIWKPYLRDLFKKQSTDPVAAEKAEWMRHVFAGTRPSNAIPRPPPRPAAPPRQPPPVTPPPRPRAGTPPPPPGPTTPPVPPPTRIPVEPIPGGGGKSPYRIIEDFSKAIGKAIRVLRMSKNGLGVYRPGSTLTAERFAGDLDTAAHELAGHWTDDRYGIGKPWVAAKTRSPYDTELVKFWPFGSVTPRSSLRYRRAEGIAEYIRAYVVNPKQAKLDAPLFSAYFEKTLPTEALKAIQDFSEDVRRWAGENPLARAGLNIRMEPPNLTERLWNALKGKGFGFETSPIDKLRLWFDDPYHYAVKADKAIRELRGGGPKLPSQEFELTARLLATHDSRMSDQFENGLVPLRPGQIRNAKGELEVQRSIDPVTRQPMTMKWLLGVFDTTSGKEKFNQDMRDTSAYMVAQRTVEKAKQLGRQENVSGIGAGIMSDVQAARELLAEVAKDPARQTRLQEGARRYRLWADQNLQMLVDAKRITPGQARVIRERNEQYVDMHRLSEEFDVANFAQRGGGIGTTKDVIKRFKGSSLELDNVYSNLLEQTDSIQKEAHRNVVMNNFVDGLRNVRELHGPDLKDFDQFGRKVTSADKNTITIYKNGKAEHWQFAPPIFESLKGIGELQTNALFTIAMMPSKFARYMITRGPSFMIRNPLRDTTERSVNSRSGSKPWDIFQGYSKSELSRYEVFGGGQFGNYIVDRHVWNREIKKVMRELVKDPTNILLSPLKLKHAWEALGEKSEKIGRIAEFRRAFDAGRKKLAEEHPTLTPEELDYNSALYAAGEARGLLDFAKAGTVMKYVNQAIPFSNASMRGLGKSIQGMRDNPGRYAMNWGLYVLAPTIAVMMWNRRNPETWKEYQQLPAYRRDFFWNLKVGDRWLMIPKPHLLGVLAGGVERILNGIMGTPHAMSGFGGGIGNALPVSNLAESSGPLKTFLELNMNRDTFRDRDIVPAWEKDLKLELRKGTKHASGAAQGIANAINTTGLGVDSRSVDHVLRSIGGWGTIATAVTTRNRGIGDTALQSTGLFTESPGTNAQDVQWVLDWARQNGKLQNPSIKGLTDLRKSYFEAKNSEEKQRISKSLREAGASLRNSIEKIGKK